MPTWNAPSRTEAGSQHDSTCIRGRDGSVSKKRLTDRFRTQGRPLRVENGPSTSTLQVFCRTDYQIATPGIASKARRAEIFTAQRFSDHAPLVIDYAVR